MIGCHEHLLPTSLEEALSILDSRRGAVTILAGGTDVIPGMQQGDSRFSRVETLLDIGRIAELKRIEQTGHVGSAVTLSNVVQSPWLRENYPLLCSAAGTVGSVQIRNRATVVGNFVNNAACADSVPPLLVYDARVIIRSKRAERIVPLSEFLLSPNRTELEPNELVTGFVLPPPPVGMSGRFYKLGRRRGIAISRITLAVLLACHDDRIAEMRIAAGAVNPIGTRFLELEQEAIGKPANDRTWIHLARRLGEIVLEGAGLRWSSEYKLPVLEQSFFGILCDLGMKART